MAHDPPDDAARHERLAALLERALRTPPERRASFIAGACVGDEALRENLISLLDAHEPARDFFDALSAQVVHPALAAVAGPSDRASESELAETLGSSLAGSYRIEHELHGGGMSRVFVAEDVRLKRRIVIKVLPPGMAPAASAARFHREIELAAHLQHPHIVPVLATDSADGMLYYTMPLVTGESLADRLAREGSLPVGEALQIWRDVLDAIAYAHANGVIHRDIKPGNILLSGRHALVTDFGIARAIETVADQGAMPAGLQFGTPAYMAPEEVAGEPEADHRADIYQAGLVMYEMLAGRPPFVGGSVQQVLVSHRLRQPPPPDRPDAPASLVQLVMRCLTKDPAVRPQCADDVLAALDAGGTGDDGSAAGSRAGGLRSRRVLPAALAAVALLVIAWPAMRRQPEPARTAGWRADTDAIAAHEWYARGMDVALLRTDSGRLQGVDYFRRAISIDTAYVDAYAGLVRMYVQLSNAAPGPSRGDWLERARRAALRAVALDDRDADARAALGWVRLMAGDYGAAEDEFDRSIALDPGVPRGYEGLARVYMMTGRPGRQLAAARRGLDADPFSHSAIRELALALATNGRCEESLDRLRSLRTLTPPAGVAGLIRGQCYASREMWPEAIAELQWAADNSATAGLAFLGYALARAGRRDEASDILSDLVEGRRYSHGAFGVATVLAGLRDYDRAFEWLDRAIDENTMGFYIMHPVFADLHRDPRFSVLEKRMRRGR